MAPRKPLKVGTKPRQAPASRGCQLGDLFRVLGKAHMLDILHVVMVEGQGEPRRFVDIQRSLRISPNTLSERLRELVDVGLLTRTAYNEIPPRVDYAPTEKALDLEAVFGTLSDWAGRHNLKPAPVPVPLAAAKGMS